MSEAILKQILTEIQGVNRRIDGLEQRMDRIEQRMDKLETEQKSLRKEFQEFREETHAELQVLKGGQQGIRNEIIDRFKEVKTLIEDQSYAIDILNRRQLKHEVEVEKLKAATTAG